MAANRSAAVLSTVDQIIFDRVNSDLLQKVEDSLTAEDADVPSVIRAVVRLFTHLLTTKKMYLDTEQENEQNSDAQGKQWLQGRYADFKRHLLTYARRGSQRVQRCAFDATMELIRLEGLYPLKKLSGETWYFPKESFEEVIKCLASKEDNMLTVINNFKRYLKVDVKLYTLKILYDVLLATDSQKSKRFLANVFCLLIRVPFPGVPNEEEDSDSDSAFISNDGGPEFVLKTKVFSKAFSQVWLQFLKCKMTNLLYKRVLAHLPKKVLPHLNEPLLLTDFLTDSYNSGGVISLLALNGIFYLMQNYNLEYPNFYRKFYSLFTIEIVTSEYQDRFFKLADLFLSSTHLPAYLVAAFVKRLSRMSLHVPLDVMIIICTFIGNLIICHPSLECLVHNPGQRALSEDPYQCENDDPATCNAMKSSLWEIQSLQNHWSPQVSKKAAFINSPMPRIKWNLNCLLTDYEDSMVRKELKTDFTQPPLTYGRPSGFLERTEDHMNDLWTL